MRKLFITVVGVVVFAAAFAQTSSRPNNMRSIVINSDQQPQGEELLNGGEGPQPPLSADERAYWECVLKHVKDQESSAALNIILAACRALSGDG